MQRSLRQSFGKGHRFIGRDVHGGHTVAQLQLCDAKIDQDFTRRLLLCLTLNCAEGLDVEVRTLSMEQVYNLDETQEAPPWCCCVLWPSRVRHGKEKGRYCDPRPVCLASLCHPPKCRLKVKSSHTHPTTNVPTVRVENK